MRTSYRMVWAVVVVMSSGIGSQAYGQAAPGNNYDALSPADLDSLAGSLLGQSPKPVADLQQLGTYVQGRLAVPAQVAGTSWTVWCGLLSKLGPYVDTATRQGWATQLQSLAAANNGLAQMSYTQARVLDGGLSQLGSAPGSGLAQWVGAGAACQDLAPADFGALAYAVRGASADCKAARQKLMDVVKAKYLGDATSIASASPVVWSMIVSGLSPDLSAEARVDLGNKLQAAFSSADAVAKLKSNEVATLCYALAGLKVAQPQDLVVAWMGASDAWKTLPPKEMATLTYLVRGETDAQKAALAQLTGQMQGTVLTDPAATRALGLDSLHGLAANVGKQLPEAQKAAWAAGLKAAYIDPAALGTLKLAEVLALGRDLKNLGDSDELAVAAAWLAAGANLAGATPAELMGLGQSVKSGGASATAVRKAIADALASVYLADPAKARQVSAWNWKSLVDVVLPALDGDAKAAWAAKLRGAYSSPETLAGVKQSDVQTVMGVLQTLGDANAQDASLMSSWMAASDAWKSLSLAELTGLAKRLNGLTDKAPLGQLTQTVWTLYLADAAKARQVSATDWRTLINAVLPALDDQAKANWAAQLRSALGSAQALASTKYADLPTLRGALEALGDAKPNTLTAAWIAASKEWQQFTFRDLADLADVLGGLGDAGQPALRQMTDYVASAVLTDPKLFRSPQRTLLPRLVAALSQPLTDDGRKTWVASLRQGLTADLAGVDRAGILVAQDTLKGLGDPDYNTFLPVWVPANSSWRQYKLDELVTLVMDLRNTGTPGVTADTTIADHLRTTLLNTQEKMRQADPVVLKNLCSGLPPDALMVVALAWTGQLRAVYLAPDAKVTFVQARAIGDLLRTLRDPRYFEVMAQSLLAGDDWHSAPVSDLARLAYDLVGADKLSADARGRLRDFIGQQFLGDGATVRTVGLRNWRQLAYLLVDAPAATQADWAKRFLAGFAASDQDLLQLKIDDARPLVEIVNQMDPKQAATTAWTWLHGAPNRGQQSLGQMIHIAFFAVGAEGIQPDDRKALLRDLETIWATQPPAAPGDVDLALAMGQAYGMLGDTAKLQEWVLKGYDLAVGTPDRQKATAFRTMVRLADRLWLSGLAEHQEEYTALAQGLAAVARTGTLRSREFTHLFGRTLAGPQSRAIIEAELLDATGDPRPEVGRVLAWIYRQNGDLKTWQAKVDQKLTETKGGNPATYALWLLVKGQTEIVVPNTEDPKRNRPWLDQALAAAATEPARLRVVQEYLEYFGEIDRRDLAVSQLDSLAAQFTGDNAVKVRFWRETLASEYALQKSTKDQQAASTAILQQQDQLRRLQTALAQARQEGNTAVAAKAQAEILRLQGPPGGN